MAFQVETYLSGVPYKERRFDVLSDALAYQSELFLLGHYCVNLIDLETADPAIYGGRIKYPLDDARSRPWVGL